MNPERQEYLLRQYFDSEITEIEMTELDAALRTRPEVRAQFWREAHVEGTLREWGLEGRGQRELQALPPPAGPLPSARETGRRFSWHPVATAAAGVVLGMLCASVAWAVHAPKASVPLARSVPIGDGSFEGPLRKLPAGLPAEFGVWGGDESRTVEVSPGKARDGKRLLQFVHANREPALSYPGAYACDVFQLVDLRPFNVGSGEAILELSAHFLDLRMAPGDPVTFLCRLHVFQGSPETLLSEWPLTQKSALAWGSSGSESAGGEPERIHQVATKILVPPRADFALVHLIAYKPKNKAGTEAIFEAHYADDVRLTLSSKPAAALR